MERLSKSEIRGVDEEIARLMDSVPLHQNIEEGPRKRRKSHKKETKKAEVSINSLLDILSVILVFLMKSYSTTSVQIKPSKDLQVPFSYSALQVEESVAVTLTRKYIMVNDVPVVTLDDAKVAEADLGDSGLLVQPLLQTLQDEVNHQKKIGMTNKKVEFKGIISFIVDRQVPFSLLTKAMYTAGQAEFSKFKFVLIKIDRG